MSQLFRSLRFGALIMAASLAVGGAISSRAASLTITTSSPGSRGLNGRWYGSYLYGGRPVGLELNLEAAKDGRLTGKFVFFALHANPNVQSGSFYVAGSYDKSANKLILKPGKWIVEPLNYGAVRLKGSYTSERSNDGKLTAHIKGVIPGCGRFDVQRIASGSAPPSYAPESASITIPDCAHMTTFALTLHGAKNLPYPEPGPAPLHGAGFKKLFGTTPYSWTSADFAAANYALNSCMNSVLHAKQQREFSALYAFNSDLKRVQQAKLEIAKREAKFDTEFKALLALPPTRVQLMTLVMLDRAQKMLHRANVMTYWKWYDSVSRPNFMWRDGAAESNLLSTKELKYASDLINQMNEFGVWVSNHMYPTLTEKRASLSKAVIVSEVSKLTAGPETLNGLNAFETMAAKYVKVDSLFLASADIQTLDKAISDRKTQIDAVLERKLETQIAAINDDASGLKQLSLVRGGAIFAALGPQQREAIIAKVGQRRNAILDTLSSKDIAHLDTYPLTLDGLSKLKADTRKIHNSSSTIGQVRMARFDAAAEKRAASIGTAALPSFEKMLSIVPETSAGLTQISAIEAKYGAVFGTLPADLKEQYLKAIEYRKGKIGEAIKAESARLAALPLVGGVFEDKKSGVTLTFRSPTHAILEINSANGSNAAANAMYDVTWEKSGGMVILHGTPQGSPVFLHKGDALEGNGLDLVRLANGKKG